MSSLATVLVGLGVVAVLGGAAGVTSARARWHRPIVTLVHALRDDTARDPVAGPLRAGCASLEIGVWLDDAGRLQVGGDRVHRDAGNAIGPLVLRALALRAQKYGGAVRPDQHDRAGRVESVTLMIEILETEPDRQSRAFEALDAALRAYPGLWTRRTGGLVALGPVTVVLTGMVIPWHLVSARSDRYVFFDGTFNDVGAPAPVALMPMVSEHWSWRFGWDGIDEIQIEEWLMLRQLVAAAHADGRQLRIFGIPERSARVRVAFWRELAAAGVDVISTTKPRNLVRFLRNSAAVPSEESRSGHAWTQPRRESPEDPATAQRSARAASAR